MPLDRAGFSGINYQRALAIEMEKNGLSFTRDGDDHFYEGVEALTEYKKGSLVLNTQ